MSDMRPLMPKATAVWLVENTSLTFEQIADLCQLHILEIKSIADGDVASGIRGKDPITGGELTRDEIRRGEADTSYRLKLSKSKVVLPPIKTKKAARYTPTSRRQDRPNAIQWLIKHHPELRDAQIIKLVGTTKPTIQQIRERSHWNSANLVPQDPVTLGLCSQIDLDAEVKKAATRVRAELEASGQTLEPAGTLVSATETTGYRPGDPQPYELRDDVELDDHYARPRIAAREADEERTMRAQLAQLGASRLEDDADDDMPDVEDVFKVGGGTVVEETEPNELEPDMDEPGHAADVNDDEQGVER